MAITDGSFAENGVLAGAKLVINCDKALCTGVTKQGAQWAVFGTSLKGAVEGAVACNGVDAAMAWLSDRLPAETASKQEQLSVLQHRLLEMQAQMTPEQYAQVMSMAAEQLADKQAARRG